MLGARDDAEDVVQEAWLRWHRAGAGADNPAAWLTTTVSRLALDRLRVRKRERARYVGPWLPEPVVLAAPEPADVHAHDPAEHALRRESLTLGFVHVLERLTPRERVAFVLAEVFDEPHAVVAGAVGSNPTASRQLVLRARRKLAAERDRDAERPVPPPGAVVRAFAAACATGDLASLLRLLDPNVVLVSDGGPTRHAARRPVVGADRVARLVTFLARRAHGATPAIEEVNGQVALVARRGGSVDLVLTAEATDAGAIRRLRIVVAPAKLAAFDRPLVLS
jgi:RNA polymerase sigma-70 factor (ECF subfamily)